MHNVALCSRCTMLHYGVLAFSPRERRGSHSSAMSLMCETCPSPSPTSETSLLMIRRVIVVNIGVPHRFHKMAMVFSMAASETIKNTALAPDPTMPSSPHPRTSPLCSSPWLPRRDFARQIKQMPHGLRPLSSWSKGAVHLARACDRTT